MLLKMPPTLKDHIRIVEETIDDVIDQLSLIKERISLEVEFYGLSEEVIDFIQFCKNDELNKING